MRIKAGGTTTTFRDSSVKLTTGQWYFAVATYDNSGAMKLYLDGVEVASGNHAVGGPVDAGPTVPVAIGANGTAERFFDGVLDDVRVYDRALGAAEITNLYADGVRGPIAHWKLDDGTGMTAVDSEGGHDGTLTNGPVWVAGQIGDALNFPGNDDYVNVPHNDALSLTDMTISLWLKATALNNVYQALLRKKQQANYQLATVDNEIWFEFNDGSGMVQFKATTAALTTNQWYHVAVTLDDTTGDVNIYVDGALKFSDTTTRHPLPNTEPLTIGGVAGSLAPWPGVLDDIRLFDYALSATEISDLFTAGSGGGGGGGGSAPVFESFEEYRDADNNSASISVDKPAGTAAGDLLVAVVVTNRNNENTLVADDPSWTLLTRDRQANSSTTGVWWKLAGSSEPSNYGFSWDAAAPARSYSWIMRFSGSDPTNPINVWSKFGDGGSTTPPSPAVTTTVNDTLILRIGGFDDDDITVGDPGMAGHTPITMQESNSGTGTVSGGAAYVEKATSGNSGTANFTLTASEQSRTITIGIAPAP